MYSQEVGDRIILKATNHLGVPVHENFKGVNDYYRLPDGSQSTVLKIQEKWYQIQHDDGTGWIIRKYIGDISEEPLPPANISPWESPDICKELVESDNKLEKNDEYLRVVSWNIRWYPYGCPTAGNCPENATDNEWLANVITWMNADILAIQEIIRDHDAETAMNDLIAILKDKTSGEWKSVFHECGSLKGQHVGFLYNSSVLNLSHSVDIGELNGAYSGRSACAGNLRPGCYAYVESKKTNGVDFHMVSVHFDSGKKSSDYNNRVHSYEAIGNLFQHSAIADTIHERGNDKDLVVIGDFNTMGCSSPYISASEEIQLLDEEISDNGFRRITISPECTEYYKGKAGVLDHIVVSLAMEECNLHATIHGYCKMLDCDNITTNTPIAYKRLSDHCPIIWDVKNEDMD